MVLSVTDRFVWDYAEVKFTLLTDGWSNAVIDSFWEEFDARWP